MLGTVDIVAFVPSSNPSLARPFYEGVLGLRFVSEDRFALVLEANGTMLRVANVSNIEGFRPAPFTILGWNVTDAAATVRALAGKGVVFERFPGLPQDPLGIWDAPGGARIAWFKDPDGNILSISQH